MAETEIEIVQPATIEESYAPPFPLPADLLAPQPARRYVEPTTEELNYRPRFLHYARDPVPLVDPPRANRLD